MGIFSNDLAGVAAPIDQKPLLAQADLHNIASGDRSWFESFGDALTSGTAAAATSGVVSLMNTAVSVSNAVLNTDYQQFDTQEILNSYDQDLGKYYAEHKEGVDLAGFIGTSLIPGTAGVKVLKMAKAGNLPYGISRALNIGAKIEDVAIKEAKSAIAISDTIYGGIKSRAALKYAGAGVADGVIEGLAFETAVAATMFESPILKDQDGTDMFFNIAINAGVFGAASGAFRAVTGLGKVKSLIEEVDIRNRPNQRILSGDKNTAPSTNVIMLNRTLNERPAAQSAVDIELQTKQLSQVENLELTELSRLTSKDTPAAELVQSSLKNMRGSQDSVNSMFYGLNKIDRPSVQEATGKVALTKETGEAGMLFDTRTGGFIDAIDAEAVSLNLGDVMKAGSKIVVNGDKLMVQGANALGITRVQQEYKIAEYFNPAQIDASGKLLGTAAEAQAHYRWALDPATPLTKTGAVITEYDFPRIEKALRENFTDIRVKTLGEDGTYSFIKPKSAQELENLLYQGKVKAAKQLLDKEVPLDEITSRLNVTEDFLTDPGAAPLVAVGKDNMQLLEQPRYLEFKYDTSAIPLNSRSAVINDAYVKQQTNLELEARKIELEQWVRSAFPDDGDAIISALPDVDTLQQLIDTSATRVGSGPSFVGFANGEYGSAASAFENMGAVVAKMTQKAKENTQSQIATFLGKLSNDEVFGQNLMLTEARLRKAKEHYVLDPTGSPRLVREDYAENIMRAQKGLKPRDLARVFDEESPQYIDLEDNLYSYYQQFSQINSLRRAQAKRVSNGFGFADVTLAEKWGLSRVYALPPNLQREKHFVFVRQEPTVQGSSSHVTIVTGQNQNELTRKIAQIKKEYPTYQVITKAENVAYRKARNDFEYGRGLNDNYIDSTLRSKGILGQVIPAIGPNAIKNYSDDLLEWHARQDSKMVRDMMEYRYAPIFQQLINLGDQFTNLATSKFENISSYLANQAENPYGSYIKTALNISRINEYPLWLTANEWIDRTATSAVTSIRNAFSSIKTEAGRTITDEEAARINDLSQKLGFGTPYKAALELAEFDVDRASNPMLSRFVSRVQSVISGTTLTTDVFNAVNNAVGNSILLSAESTYVINAIKSGDAKAAGKLAEIAHVVNPANPEQSMLAPAKLIANSISRFFKDDSLREYYKKLGVDVSELDQHRLMMDNIAVSGKETLAEFNSKLDKVLEAGRKMTGNKFVESFNRFVAADTMKQLTDIAIDAGKMSEREAASYIRTFVNRTQGNVLASQRPVIFQGAIGQAIGLFQTYQFNLIQQALRYAKNQNKLPLMTLAGMQSSMYGLQGLPAFNAISTHLVGNAYGNVGHDDLYTGVYDVAGKQAGDWLLYGVASNILGTNLYTRGDINPRQITVIPTTPDAIPFVSASARFAANILDVASKIAGGGDVANTLLQGLEHNGLSRPLAGLAQVLQGESTTSEGSILAATGGGLAAARAGEQPSEAIMDMFRLSNLARIGGSKLMDEAIAFDSLYRLKAYQAKDAETVRKLGERIRTKLTGNQTLDSEDFMNFSEDYMKAGGNLRNFNRFVMKQVGAANQSKVNEVAGNLNNPLSQNMLKIMGGRQLPDFSNGLLAAGVDAGDAPDGISDGEQ